MKQRFLNYLRLSTRRQADKAISLQTQRNAARRFAEQQQAEIVAEMIEVESGRKTTERRILAEALERCASEKLVLLISRLDRLARDARFLFELRDSNVEFIALDCVGASRLTVGVLAVVAEAESERISERVKASYETRRKQGKKFGNAKTLQSSKIRRKANATARRKAKAYRDQILPIIHELIKDKLSHQEIAEALTRRGFKTPRGKAFCRQAVCKLLNS